MAAFDVRQQRMCVRVVYDGAASAGKTTNLRQLAELFATQTTCELVSPAELGGRTLYFDWLQIAAGMVCGVPLLCQVITVPGQLVLTPRRRHLLSSADVVVHVCDSTLQSMSRAADGFSVFDEVESARGVAIPLVLQANKQDEPGARAGSELVALLGRPSVPAVEAIASDGIGVVDTFIAAVRAVVRSIQARVDLGEVRVPISRAETADDVFGGLSGEAVDPDWAAELMLEEACNAFALGDAFDSTGVPQSVSPDAASSASRSGSIHPVPSLPTEHVPTGFVWPAHTGRAALRALATELETRRAVALDDGGGVSVVLTDFLVSTDLTRRHDSAESARQSLVRAARERTQLGSLLAPETVIIAQPASDGSTWLWTVLPRMDTVIAVLASSKLTPEERTGLVTMLGVALADAIYTEVASGVSLDLALEAFGVRDGHVRYLRERRPNDSGPRDAGTALRAAIAALARVVESVEPAVAAFESSLASRWSVEERSKLLRLGTWTTDDSMSAEVRDASARILGALDEGRSGA